MVRLPRVVHLPGAGQHADQPAPTPGGLSTQFSSIGHYALADDEALVVEVPACDAAPYQAIQVGSKWYVLTDYEHHQTR